MDAATIRNRINRTLLPDVCRIIVGVLFLFSGFTKIIDPYGTALKIKEYLGAMGLGAIDGVSTAASVGLVSVEVVLGIMLVLRIWPRLVSLATFLFMAFYTLLTLWLAVWNPIADCGCFGDVIVLTNWQTFFKNLIMLPLSAFVWWCDRDFRFWTFKIRYAVITLIAAGLSVGFAIYNLRHLPLIDTTPFKVGVDLRKAVEESPEKVHTVLIFRNRSTGELHEFQPEDEGWWDSNVWEYVDTRTTAGGDRVAVTPRDFIVYDAYVDFTRDILDFDGVVQLICVQNINIFTQKEIDALERFAAEAQQKNQMVVCVTASPLSEASTTIGFGSSTVPLYNMDITTMQLFLRANKGVVTLRDGRIADKRTVRDLCY